MKAKKTLNTSRNGYYAVIITADYCDNDAITSWKKLSVNEFEKAVPMLTDLLTKAIGDHALRKYLEAIDDDELTDDGLPLPSEIFCKTLGITDISFASGDAFPHSVKSADDVKILYFAPSGTNYYINLM